MVDFTADDHEWDSRCKQCGRCCFEKIEDERGNIFYTQTACRFLDVISRECKIFERRFEINPSCIKLTPELVRTLRWLPCDCGYHHLDVGPVPASKKAERESESEENSAVQVPLQLITFQKFNYNFGPVERIEMYSGNS